MKWGWGGWYIGITDVRVAVCLSVRVCPDDIFGTAEAFATCVSSLASVVHIVRIAVFKVKVTVEVQKASAIIFPDRHSVM